jgi:membrane-associated protease RseP (regulator of RpoE activity)
MILAIAAAGLLVLVASLAAGRWAAALPFGRAAFLDAMKPWVDTGRPLALRLARAVGGTLAWYLAAAALFAAGLAGGGAIEVDEASLRVEVAGDGPADRAGLSRGDRVVSVDGRPVATWDELRASVRDRGDEEVAVAVEREGEVLVFDVVPEGPPGAAKIRIGPFTERRLVSAPAAFGAGLSEVLRVSVVRLVGTHAPPAEVVGPVGIVRAVGAAEAHLPVPTGLRLSGLLGGSALPIVLVASFAVVIATRARRRGSSPAPGRG